MGQYSSFNMFLFFRFPLALSRKRIGLKSMLGVYLVLITGLFIAFVTLLVERYWYKKKLTESIVNKLVIRLWINSNTWTHLTIIMVDPSICVVVQFCPWFYFISFCFKLIIIHYHTQKQREIKFKRRIKLNSNICTSSHSLFLYLHPRTMLI